MLNRRQMMLQTGAAALLPGAGYAAGDFARQIAALGRPLRLLVPNGSQANLAPVKRSFEARYGCQLQLIATDLDNINATLTIEAITRDQQIDAALPATFGIPDLAEGGAIQPIDDLAPFDSDVGPVSALYNAGDEFDGRRWGYQTDGDVYMMFYNDGLLRNKDYQHAFEDRFGTILDVPRDWATLDKQMAFFHQPESGIYGGCLFRTAIYAAWEWWARFHAQGVWPFSPEMEPQIAGDAGIAALEAMIKSAEFLTGSQLGLFDNWERYKRGDIFANIGWGGTQKSLYAAGSEMRGKVRAGPLPSGRDDGGILVPISYFNWGWSYVITRHCPAPELAHVFARHAVSGQVSSKAVAEAKGFFDPFREEHYSAPKIINTYGEPFLKQHHASMKGAMPDLYLARRNEYFEALSYWIGLALAKDVSAPDALENIANMWRLTTSRVGHTAQAARWVSLRERYPAALRSFLKDL